MMIGKTLKIIRENKGLTQHAFSKDIVTPSYYSKIESGTSKISAELLFEILEASNITIQEFYYIKKSYKSESQISVLKQIRLHFNKGDLVALESLNKELNEMSSDENYFLLINNLINYLKGNKLDESTLNTLKDYLVNVPGWGHYEFQLFSLCSYLFEADTLILLFSNVIRNIDKYEEFINYEQDLLITLINLVQSFLSKSRLEDAHYFLRLAKSTHKNPLFIYERLLIDFFDCLLGIEFNRSENEIKAYDIIEFFESIDLHYTAKNLDSVLLEQLNKFN